MKILQRPLLLFVCFLLATHQGWAWGPVGHRWVTQRALENLEEPLRGLLGRHEETLLGQSMAADYRKDRDPTEAPRHFVDLEEYPPPVWEDPKLDYQGLLQTLGRNKIRTAGSGPWAAAHSFQELVDALRGSNLARTLLKASDLGHYVADLHQPLHTTQNHDGQFTGQRGIHSRLESELLNRYQDRIRFRPLPPTDLGPVQPALKWMVRESHREVDSILAADRSIVEELEINRQPHSGRRIRVEYSDAYFRLLFQETGDLIEDRLNQAAHRLASLWWMAWNRAGKPRFGEPQRAIPGPPSPEHDPRR